MDGGKTATDYALEQLGGSDLGERIASQVAAVLRSAGVASDEDEPEGSLPDFSCELIEQLDRENPERTPYSDEAERDYSIYLGRRQLINELKRKMNERKRN